MNKTARKGNITSMQRTRLVLGLLLCGLLLIAAGCQTESTPAIERVQKNIPYLDLEEDFNVRTVDVYLPEASAAPHPTIFALPGGAYTSLAYAHLAELLVERGYAVVLTNYRKGSSSDSYSALGGNDVHCAFAWMMDNAAAYELDPQRIFLFGHTAGGMAATEMPLHGAETWEEYAAECPYPIPDTTAIQGVITYDALLGMPGGTLGTYPMVYADSWNIPGSEMMAAVEALSNVAPKDWNESEELDDSAQKLAGMLPLYWVYKANDEQRAAPPQLLIYDSDSTDGFDWVTEAESMAEHMRAAGIAVTLDLLDNAKFQQLTDPETDVPARVAERTDVFISETLK